jgi:outer membrane protein TolC
LKSQNDCPFGPAFRLVAVAALLNLGCAPIRQPEAPVRAVAADAGLADAIEFRDVPDPVDVPSTFGGRLSLPDAVRRALGTSPAVQQALGRVRTAQADAWQTRLLPNPVLTVAFRFPENSGKPVIEAGLAADLIALLQRPGRIEAADDRLRAVSAEVVTAALDVIAEVEEHYTSAAASEASVAILRQRLKLLGQLLDLARARLAAGEGTQLDITTLDAQRVDLETDLAERAQEAADERLILARLVGQPSGGSDWVLDTPVGARAPALPRERALLDAATSRRPEIAALTWQLAALGADVRLARFAPFEGGDVGIASERDEHWTVGPAFSTPLPIFDWGQARKAKSVAARVEAGHKLTEQRRRVVEEVRRAYAAVLAASATAERVRTELIPLQQRRRDQAEAAYRTGNADVTVLLLADNDLQTARAKLVDLDRRTALSLSKLRRAVGGAAVADALTPPSPATVPTTAPSSR